MAHEDVAGLEQIVAAAVAGRIVQRDAQIGLSRQFQTLFDLLPGSQQIGKTDHGEVMGQGRAQHGAAAEGRRDPGDDHDLQGLVRRQLQDQSGHAVDPGVAAGDHGHVFALQGGVDGHATVVHFLSHGSDKVFLLREQGLDQFHINAVPGDDVHFFQGLHGLSGHLPGVAGADADDIQLIQR